METNKELLKERVNKGKASVLLSGMNNKPRMNKIIMTILILSCNIYSFDFLCEFKKVAIAETEGKGKFKSSAKSESFSFIITDALAHPKLSSNNGEDTLVILSINKSDQVVYLMEMTGLGNVNIITLFLKTREVILTKQYNLFSNPFGMVMIGKFTSYGE